MNKSIQSIIDNFNPYNHDICIRVSNENYSYSYLLPQILEFVGEINKYEDILEYDAIYLDARKVPEYFSAVIACLITGKAFVPLDIKLPKSRRDRILSSGLSAIHITIDKQRNTAIRMVKGSLRAKCQYILYTSGSSGEPKGVRVSKENLNTYIGALSSEFHFNADDRFSFLFDLTFDLSIHDMFIAFSHGASICIPEPEFSLLSDYINQYKVSVFFSVPTLVSMSKKWLMNAEINSIRLSFFCGEKLLTPVAIWWKALTGGIVVNLYGPTETTIAVSQHRVEGDNNYGATIPIGSPLEGTKFLLEETKISNLFQLQIAGKQVAAGYLSSVSESGFYKKDTMNCYDTSDLVSLSDHGLEFHSRVGDILKVNGYRLSRNEIELYLSRAVGSEDIAVFIVDITHLGIQKLAASIPIEYDGTYDDIKKSLQENLPGYMIPSDIYLHDELPKNINGKMDYKEVVKSHSHLKKL
ncbi:AMP-binding protein [Vibrio splendidus]